MGRKDLCSLFSELVSFISLLDFGIWVVVGGSMLVLRVFIFNVPNTRWKKRFT